MSGLGLLPGVKPEHKILVELIVVLVILAILAAILVPALLGYIDKAREKQYVLDARSIYVATQAYVDEQYGKSTTYASPKGSTFSATGSDTTAHDEIVKMADVNCGDIKIVDVADRIGDGAGAAAEINAIIIKGLGANEDGEGGKTAKLNCNAGDTGYEETGWVISDDAA